MTSYATPVGPGIEEASSLLVPAEGVSVYQAIQDAQLAGYRSIEVHPDNTATIIWYKKES